MSKERVEKFLKKIKQLFNYRKLEPSTMIYTGTNYVVGLYNEDIKSIITREQIEQMSYKVGEEYGWKVNQRKIS